MTTTTTTCTHNHTRIILVSLLIMTCIKILCMPAYRSTDFDVHRNWKALTRHLPIEQWYFDDHNGTTVHTLDYPPLFAYFEYMWSNNVLVEWLMTHNVLKERCLALLPDDDNEVDMFCVVFLRSTVILSDIILWWGAWLASCSMASTTTTTASTTTTTRVTLFLLIVLHPGLLWLDHVHFQYNGMLLGILLASISYLLKPTMTTYNVTMAAILYCLLMTLKHLYVGLAPWYFVVLLHHYCRNEKQKFVWKRFIYLAVLTLSILLLVFLPFLSLKQLQQVFQRLFPFGRGLCHDYPAANVWSLYVVTNKVIGFVTRQVGMQVVLPTISPLTTLILWLLSMIPGLYVFIMTHNDNNNKSLLLPLLIYCSLCAFLWNFHVHEKAILTTLIPLTLLSTTKIQYARLYMRLTCIGLVGLFPLLFRVNELSLKLVSFMAYMSGSLYVLQQQYDSTNDGRLLQTVDYAGMIVLVAVVFFLEMLHPLFLYPWMEALPLLMTSVTCAIGIIACWIQSGRLLLEESRSSTTTTRRPKMD